MIMMSNHFCIRLRWFWSWLEITYTSDFTHHCPQ